VLGWTGRATSARSKVAPPGNTSGASWERDPTAR
jgi:hypothetical protein